MRSLLAAAGGALLLTACAANGGMQLGSTRVGDSCGDLGWGTVLGSLTGGAAGGLAGSQFSHHGSTDPWTTAIGAAAGLAAGAWAGGKIDEGSCLKAHQAQQAALAPSTPLNQSIAWTDPASGNHGSFTPTREGRAANGAYCRAYTQTIVIDGKREQAAGQACQRSDGTWEIVSS